MIESCKFMHPELGKVNLRALSTARNLTARYRNGVYHVTAPSRLTSMQLLAMLDEMTPRLKAMAEQLSTDGYYDGFTFENDLVAVSVHESDHIESTAIITAPVNHGAGNNSRVRFVINVGHRVLTNPDATQIIEKHLDSIARRVMRAHVLGEAQHLSRAGHIVKLVGRIPASIEMSYGRRTLGRCNSRGEILLSHRLAFMPEELRRAVITHELTHLVHLDHSPRFYGLWERLYGAPVGDMRRRYASAPSPYMTR